MHTLDQRKANETSSFQLRLKVGKQQMRGGGGKISAGNCVGFEENFYLPVPPSPRPSLSPFVLQSSRSPGVQGPGRRARTR